jgi:membrane associated rhomboid family serine protease
VPSPDFHAETVIDGIPADLVEAGVYATSKEGFDHGLVVLTLGYPFWLTPAGDAFRLLVEPHAFIAVREQLACFDRESVGWPPRPIVDHSPARKTELFTPLLWCLAVLAAFWAQGEWPGFTDAGVLDPQALFDRGEWWRPITALFLHADIGHLVSNALSGVFVFSALLTTFGCRRGWLLLALAAVAGNLAVAALNHPGSYRSLGASTAIFAAIGLLTGRAIRVVLRADHPHRWRTLFVPLATGLTVLALYGAGGQQVDVVAHVTGFVSGMILGFFGCSDCIGARQPSTNSF